MKYISERTDFKIQNSAVTLGKFDGLHIGHQLLLNKIIELKKKSYTAVMFSFAYHPSNLFSAKELDLIYTEDEKSVKLADTGLDVLISYPFSSETASMEPEQFVEEILIEKLDAKVIVVGSDFCFGRKRRGNVALLESLSAQYGYEVIAYDKVSLNQSIVSSTLIRSEIAEGKIAEANAMLGRPYSIIGEVMHGRKIGRTLGMPTTNLIPSEHKLLPPNGVYATRTVIKGVSYLGVTNIGYKPTVGAESVKGVETYLFDYDGDLYGKVIEVDVYSFLRGERKFESLEALKEQILKDIKEIKRVLSV